MAIGTPTPAASDAARVPTARSEAPATAAGEGREAVQRGYDDLAATMRGNVGGVLASSHALMNGLQAVNAELLGFIQGRLRHGMTYGQALAGCGSFQEALELQAGYARDAARAYVEELGRIGELTGRVMNDCWAPLRRRGERAAEIGAPRAP